MIVPPADLIFSSADLEKASAFMFIFFEISPCPKILRGFFPSIFPNLTRSSLSISDESEILSSVPTFSISNSTLL